MARRTVFIALISSLIIFVLWYFNIMTTKWSMIIGGSIILICITIQAIIYKLAFSTTKIQDIKFSKFTFCFKDYDCNYSEVKSKVFKELVESDLNMLKSQPITNYMEIYTDRTISKNKKAGHVLAGFALRSYAENDFGIGKVLECLNYKRVQFSEFETVVGSMEKAGSVHEIIAMGNLVGNTLQLVMDIKNMEGVHFMWLEKKKLVCGVFIDRGIHDSLAKISIPSTHVQTNQ